MYDMYIYDILFADIILLYPDDDDDDDDDEEDESASASDSTPAEARLLGHGAVLGESGSLTIFKVGLPTVKFTLKPKPCF